MRESTFSNDTMGLRGPVMDGSTQAVYCDVHCAEDSGDATEDALFEVNPEAGDVCAFCRKPLVKNTGGECVDCGRFAPVLNDQGECKACHIQALMDRGLVR